MKRFGVSECILAVVVLLAVGLFVYTAMTEHRVQAQSPQEVPIYEFAWAMPEGPTGATADRFHLYKVVHHGCELYVLVTNDGNSQLVKGRGCD